MFQRVILTAGIVCLGFIWQLSAKDPDVPRPKLVPARNFQSSFMTWDLPPRKDPRPYARHIIPLGNKAHIQLEALIDVIDEATGKSEQFAENRGDLQTRIRSAAGVLAAGGGRQRLQWG